MLNFIVFLILLNAQTFNCIVCNDFCSIEDRHKSCFCDQCNKYLDCCADAYISKITEINNNEKCSKLHESTSYVYLIERCPVGYGNIKIKEMCENSTETNILKNVPVYSPLTNLTYKNFYCAECNSESVKSKYLNFFSIQLEYYDYDNETRTLNELIDFINGNKLLPYSVAYPFNNGPRGCIITIGNCSINYINESIINMCINGPNAVRFGGFQAYKNEYCATCNFLSEQQLNCFPLNGYIPIDNSNLQLLFDLSSLAMEIKITVNQDSYKKMNFSLKESIFNLNATCNDNHSIGMLKKYLTISGQIISIISLIILVIFYCKNRLTKNIPSKILMNLCIALIMSQSFFLLSIYFTDIQMIIKKNDPNECLIFTVMEKTENLNDLFKQIWSIFPCFITGLLAHYFHLTFFMWSNIMAYDFYKMFYGSLFSKLHYKSDSSYKKLVIIAWSFPLIPIIILNLKNYNKISYGFKLCFISSTIDLLIFFIIPILLILVLNFIFLILSIYSIRSVDKISKKYLDTINEANNVENKKRLILFIKLSVLTGMTWIFGILSSAINDKYSFLWYIFILFNSLQGLFIFFSYAFNKIPKSTSITSVSKSRS